MSLRTRALRTGLAAGAAILPLSLASASAAQDLPQAVGEIIVTAQKRTERLQDVPLAVTALSSQALDSRQINDTTALTRAVTSLTYQPGAHSQSSGFRIRGVGTQLFSLGVEASVSVTIDGVPAARQTQGFADFADLERIEVLRGPQGTLFGKNATAGVINIVTAQPTRTLQGSVDTTLAEGGEYRVKGTVSGPLTDTLLGRLSGYYNKVGGYPHNQATGKDTNGAEGWGLRGKLAWEPSDTLRFLLAGDYRRSDNDCCNSILYSVRTPALAALTPSIVASDRNRTLNDDDGSTSLETQTTISLQGDWKLPGATVTSITAFQRYIQDANNIGDQLNNPAPTYLGAGVPVSKTFENGGGIDLKQFSQELRLASAGDGRLTYVVGGLYSHVVVDRSFLRRRAICANGVFGQPCPSPTYQSSALTARDRSDSLAAFGQAEYKLWRGLEILGGLRLQHESTSVTGTRIAAPIAGDQPIPGNASNSGRRSASDTAASGKAGLKYVFSRNAQVYATYTRGYKGLGFNTELATDFSTQNPIQPEHVNAYEIGFKGIADEGRLTFAAAAFLSDYTNLQINANRSDYTTGVIQNVPTNAGSATTKGVELEASWRPVQAVNLGASFTYADTSVDINGLNCPLQFQAAAPVYTSGFPTNACYRVRTVTSSGAAVTLSPVQDVRGGKLPYSPKYRLSVTGGYEHPLPGAGYVGFTQVTANFQSRQSFAIEQDPLLMQKAYAIVDLVVGVRDAADRYSASIFVRNLFDQSYVTSISHGGPFATAATPYDLTAFVNKDADRYVGLQLGAKF